MDERAAFGSTLHTNLRAVRPEFAALLWELFASDVCDFSLAPAEEGECCVTGAALCPSTGVVFGIGPKKWHVSRWAFVAFVKRAAAVARPDASLKTATACYGEDAAREIMNDARKQVVQMVVESHAV